MAIRLRLADARRKLLLIVVVLRLFGKLRMVHAAWDSASLSGYRGDARSHRGSARALRRRDRSWFKKGNLIGALMTGVEP